MSINQAKKAMFARASSEKWKHAAENTLKGKSIDTLYTETYEEIKLSPVYTKEDIENLNIDQLLGTGSFLRGFQTGSASANQWKIAQKLRIENWASLESALSYGQDAISFDIEALADISKLNFSELTRFVDINKYPFFLTMKSHFPIIAEKLLQCKQEKLTGVVATDLLSSGLDQGYLYELNSKEWCKWAETVEKLDKHIYSLRTILIDTTSYHVSGANAVHELAIALGEAVFYIEFMKKRGFEPAKTVQKLVFHFSIGSHFFMEVAKLRAFRKLWKTVADAYHIPKEKSDVIMSAETSSFTKSKLDPYVNMLRAGNEGFAAVLGGVDFLHVAPFDELSSSANKLSERIARNTQLLLREESYLNKVADPAGGSYYVESLTASLVQQAWEFFQAIDLRGGIFSTLESGWLQQHIKETMKRREEDISTRTKSNIGVNVYAQLEEPFLEGTPIHSPELKKEGKVTIEALPERRLSEGYESLRKRSALIAEKGRKPYAGLICLGNLKDYKGRADFTADLFASGGIQAVFSPDCHTLTDVQAFVEKAAGGYYCICGTDEKYKELAAQIGTMFKEKYPEAAVEIAGRFHHEELKKWNVQGAVYSGQNVYKKLDSLLTRWEVR